MRKKVFLESSSLMCYNKCVPKKYTISKGGHFDMENRKIKTRLLATLAALGIAVACIPAVTAGADDIYEGSAEIRTAASANTRASIPSDAYILNLNINGRRVLGGRVFNYNGTTYVPMAAFADWLGVFTHSFDKYSSSARLSGTNLSVSARAGDSYITANDRYFYSENPVMLIGSEIYVPILAITKALNSRWEWRPSESCFYIYSGDSRLLKSGAQVYNADEVYWLARIISAEAKGEPMKGKIAVGNVVLNRVRSAAYPNTIYGVIFDRKFGIQFAPVANGTIYQTPTVDSIIAAKICLEGYSLSDKILYFVNPVVAPGSWISKNRPYAFTVGNHVFFE
jgi:N-acetylmuramoyl-L-alanine amidase